MSILYSIGKNNNNLTNKNGKTYTFGVCRRYGLALWLYDLKYRDWYWPTLERSLSGEITEPAQLKKAAWQTPKVGDHIWQYIPMDPNAEIRVVAKDIFGNVIADFKARAK